MVNLVKILDEAPENRLQNFRLRNIMKASLVIIDEIGYTSITCFPPLPNGSQTGNNGNLNRD